MRLCLTLALIKMTRIEMPLSGMTLLGVALSAAPLFGVTLTAAAPSGPASDPAHLAIGQGVGTAPELAIYLDLVDDAGAPPSALDVSQIGATIGPARAVPLRAAPFRETGEGVAYIFLVDVSRSLSPADMARVRAALDHWAANAGPRDRLALIAFGDTVSTRIDFTADRAAFAAAVRGLRPQDATTRLHNAIERAIELGRRLDPDLPARRVAVLLSDGKDEGSGLTADDVAALVRQDRLPIYAIGYSGLAGRDRAAGLDALLRLARNSGGLFAAAAARTDVAEVYAAMQRAIGRVFAVTLRCESCPRDGQLHRLDLQVKTASRVLSAGIDLRLPAAADRGRGAGTSGAGGTDDGGAAGRSGGSGDASDGAAAAAASRQPLVIGGSIAGLLALAALAAWIVWRRRRRRAASARAAAGADGASGDAVAGGDTAGVIDAADAAEAAAAAGVQAGAGGADRPPRDGVAITCHFRGRGAPPPFTIRLFERLLIGRDADCAIVIADDDEVAPAHAELSWSAGRVVLRRLTTDRATLINGGAIGAAARYPIESGDLLLVGRTELRLMLDEPTAEAGEVAEAITASREDR